MRDSEGRAEAGPWAAVARRLGPDLAARAPRKYERIGDVVVLKLPPEFGPGRRAVAAAYADVLRAKTVVADRGIRGPWREPDVEVLFGEDTETVHVEDGVRFRLDVAQIMLSSGNVGERMRMGRVVRPGETVVDLFAGIGYFTLPMAVKGRPSRVVACEVNPTAHGFLLENIRMNRAACVEARLGDCRVVAPPNAADRIVMGNLHGETYLDVAMRTAKAECTLHYHEAAPTEVVPEGPWSRIRTAATIAGFDAELLAVHGIKSYAPRIRHVVLDVRLHR